MSWDDCKTLEDYYAYSKKHGTHKKVASDMQRMKQDEAYRRCLKNTGIEAWKKRNNK